VNKIKANFFYDLFRKE